MRKTDKKIIQWTSFLFLIVSVPVFIISFYNVPCADDFTFGKMMNSWICENGYDVIGMLKCAVQNAIDYYFCWQGRYSESFFASFMPEIFNCYWLWTIFLYCFFALAIINLFRTLTEEFLGRYARKDGICIGMLICTAIIQNIPFPVEAFFWFDGSMAYMFHHTLYVWMCVLAVKYYFDEERLPAIRHLIVMCVLSILVAGGNNVTAFVSILTFCVFIGISLLIHRKWGILAPSVFSICGFLVSYLSPGTRIRGGDSSNYTPIFLTIKNCFVWTIKQYLIKWMFPAIIILLLFLTPLLLRFVKEISLKHHFRFPFPAFIAGGAICFLSAMSSPSFYILGEPGPGRMRNIIYVNYVIILVICYGYFLGWLNVKYGDTNMFKKMCQLSDRGTNLHRVVLICLLFVILCIGKSERPGISLEAVQELTSGQAAIYKHEANVRKEIYLDANVLEAEVEPYSVKPALLFFDDITDDPENWKNKGLAEFYGKDSVRLNRYDPDVDYD